MSLVTASKMNSMVEAVKTLAKARYSKSYGWQVIVECYEDSEIAQELTEEKITTVAAARKYFTKLAALRSDVQSDHDAERRSGL